MESLCLLPTNEYEIITIPVSNYDQQRTYWCEPACAQHSISFHKRISGSSYPLPSQTTLADKIGTTTSGSSTGRIAQALNSSSGKFGQIYYVSSDFASYSSPLVTFRNRIVSMTYTQKTAPIVLLQTKYLPRYRLKYKYVRHYVTIYKRLQ